MTGLELLREEMLRRGCTKSQCDSKTVAIVLDILANTGHVYSDIQSAEEDLNYKRKVAREYEIDAQRTQYKLSAKADEIAKKEKEYREFVDAFNQTLLECNTDEGRDRMRAAQMFVNTVDVDSKYDNTAFIIGLGAILSGGKYDAMEKLKSMNPKLFNETK